MKSFDHIFYLPKYFLCGARNSSPTKKQSIALGCLEI